MNNQRSERGQALVLIILAIVAIFGFAALAVDGGRLYSERRRAQNAADASALAAGRSAMDKKPSAQILNAALDIAAANGFNNDGVTNTVTYNHPPVGGPYDGNPEYYQVIIDQKVNPIFIQFVLQGSEAVNAGAVVHAALTDTLSEGNAVHALDTNGEAVDLAGDVGIDIVGGNILSNAAGTKRGNAHGQDAGVNITSGAVLTVGGWTNTRMMTVTGGFQQIPSPEFVRSIPQPYCPASTWTDPDTGQYYWVGDAPSLPTTLSPGIYCITSGTLMHSVSGKYVLLVFLNQSGMKMTGNDRLAIERYQMLKDKNGNDYGGLVIWADPNNHGEMTMGGNSNNSIQGSVYAPGMACDIGGTAGTTAHHAQFICDTVKFHGTAGVNIVYREPELYHFPPMLELAQ